MNRVFYNKLIRDKIPEKIKSKGESYEIRKIEDEQEFEQELLKKVIEEASGLSRVHSRDEFLDEYADLKIVLDSLVELYGFSNADINNAVEKNMTKKGKFDEQYFLNWSEDSDYKSNETPQGTQVKK